MGDIKVGGQFRQCLAQAGVHTLGAGGAAHHQQHGLLSVKAQQGQPFFAAAGKQLRPQGRAGHFRFAAQGFRAFREGGGKPGGEGLAQLVGQAGSQVAFMAEHRNPVQPGAEDHRYRDEAALGEHHVRFDFAHQPGGLEGACDHPEGIGKVLPVVITAEFAALHRVIGHPVHGAHLRRFHSVLRTDIVDFVPGFLQPGNQRQVRRHMAQGSAAGQNDFLQKNTPVVSMKNEE